MGSIWFSKKAFLYFSGTAIILLGGIIIIFSPYHYINYALLENVHKPWDMYDKPGYYEHLRISVSLRPTNASIVELDLCILENSTHELTTVNMTLGPEHQLVGPDTLIYEYEVTIDLSYGNYTVWLDRVAGTGNVDLGLNQASDSRLWIVIGGSMNLLGWL